MLDGYNKVTFMEALKAWDETDKNVVCIYKETKTEFPMNCEWRTDFKVDGGMILDGQWFVEIKLTYIDGYFDKNQKGGI